MNVNKTVSGELQLSSYQSGVHIVIEVVGSIIYCIWSKMIQKTFFFEDFGT